MYKSYIDHPTEHLAYNAFVEVVDGKAIAWDKSGKRIAGPSSDHYSVISNVLSQINSGKIVLDGEFTLANTIDVKPGVILEGLGKDKTIINAPAGAPAFQYVQPTGSTSVVKRPLLLRDLTIKIPSSGGPHYAIKVDCSAYGCSDVELDNVVVDGWNADGLFDKDSATPHTGIDLSTTWNFKLRNVEIAMPGIDIRITNYGVLKDAYLDGGANGKAIGVLLDGYRARIKAINLVTEKRARPAIKSTQASLYFDCYSCHFEAGGFDVDPPEAIIELDYPGGTYEVGITLHRLTQRYIAMNINKVYGSSRRWFNTDTEIDNIWQPWGHSITSGAATTSFVEDRIVVDNTSGTVDADCDIPITKLVYNEMRVGGYVKGVGEVQFLHGTKLTAIGIDSIGNLYLRMADSSITYDETITIDNSGAGEYDILGFIELQSSTKHLVYGVGGVYQSKIATFTNSLGFMAPGVIRIHVPAGQKLEFRPRFYRYFT